MIYGVMYFEKSTKFRRNIVPSRGTNTDSLKSWITEFRIRGGIYMRAEFDIWFKVFKAVTTNNAVFWDVASCGSCKNRCFKWMYRLHLQGRKNRQTRKTLAVNAFRLLVTSNLFPSSPIIVTLSMEALLSSEPSVLTRATRRNIPEYGIPQASIGFAQSVESEKLITVVQPHNIALWKRDVLLDNGAEHLSVYSQVYHNQYQM
jgi:hypothetical protein